MRVLLPARRRCAPEFWVRSAIRPYPGFPFAGIRVIRGHLQPSAPLRFVATAVLCPFGIKRRIKLLVEKKLERAKFPKIWGKIPEMFNISRAVATVYLGRRP
jgi:hypothetical protein